MQCFHTFAQHALLSSVGFECFMKQPDNRVCGLCLPHSARPMLAKEEEQVAEGVKTWRRG